LPESDATQNAIGQLLVGRCVVEFGWSEQNGNVNALAERLGANLPTSDSHPGRAWPMFGNN